METKYCWKAHAASILTSDFGFCRAAATGPGYPTAQTGYAVPATTAATYGAQRTGYDQAYQAAANQGQYASKCKFRSGLLVVR